MNKSLLFVSPVVLSIAAFAQTASPLPYSGAVLVYRAAQTSAVPETCSPAPCVLPSLDIYPSTAPVNETPLAVNPNNRQQLIAGANDYNCNTAAQGGVTGVNTSSDGGATWTHHCMDLLNGAPFIGDPGVAYDLNGDAYLSSIYGTLSAIGFQKSSDNGKTWQTPKLAFSSPDVAVTDKPWMQIDTAAASPFKNSIYISDTDFFSQSSSQNRISLHYSRDGGDTWTAGYVGDWQLTSVDQFSDIATDSNGTVYLTWQRCTPLYNPWLLTNDCGGTLASYYLVKSADGGVTWTQPQIMFQAQLNLDSCACAYYGNVIGMSERVSNIPVIAVDNSTGPYRGKLYVVFYNWSGSFNLLNAAYVQGQMQINIASSVDGGTTWTTKLLTPPDIFGNPGSNGRQYQLKNQFFPWLSVSKGGTVGVTWLDTRDDQYDQKYNVYATFSGNGGRTFTSPVRLSTAISNPFQDGFGGAFIGDYTGNAWSGQKLFASYTSTSTGIDQDFLVGYLK